MTISWNWTMVSGCQSGGVRWEGVIRMGQNQGGLCGLESSCILTTVIVTVNLQVWWNGRERYPYIQTLESPLEIKPANSKGNQAWLFIGSTDGEAEAPILCPPYVKSWLIVKDPDAGKDWRQKEKGMTEDEMPSPTWWTWVWASSRSWWWTGKPGMLQSMGSQRVGHDWVTQLNWADTRILDQGRFLVS